jgi:DNA-binding NtrC family response regulator
MATVLFVDDEEPLRRAVRTALGRRGHTIHTASTLARAIHCLELYRFDGVFVDVWLGGESGFDLVSWIENHQPRLAKRVVFVTGDLVLPDRMNREVRALGLPVVGKPFAMAELEAHALTWDPPAGSPRADARA